MMNRKKWITWVIIWSCVISMLLGNANVSAQETHPSFPFTVSDAQSMVYSQLYSVAMTATSGALYTFDTSATEADYQLKFFVNAGTSFHAQIYDASGVCRLDRIFTNAQYARFSLTQSTTYYLYINGEIGTAGEVLLSKVADDFGDTMQSAFAMSFNQEYAVSTEIANDEDYLCFTPNGDDASYVLCIEPIIGTTAQYEVWAAGQRIDPYCGTIGTGKIAFELSMRAGQSYYLKITSTQQGHQVIVSVLKNIRNYEVRYHLNGGNNVSGNRTVFAATDSWKLQNPTRQGYTFGGWYLTPKMTGRVYNMSGAGRKSVDLYAKWNAVRITKGSTVKVQKKKKSMKISFGKIAGASRYRLQVSTNAKYQKAKTYTLKTTSKSISRNTKSNYYIRVCGYNIDSTGTKIYGGYSTTKKVTADKTKKKSTKKASKKKSRSKKKKTSKKKSSSKKKKASKKKSSSKKKKASKKKSSSKKKKASKKKSSSKKKKASKKTSAKRSIAKKTSKKTASKKKSTAKKTSSANKKKANTKKSVSKKTNSISKKK
ncbi:InlB B-repeat-containing protein [Jutongia hominis]|uniref:InlB B-repeat-containing protein n=1 Tax=Jutongia hominis TaxID=2763664 RepID=A0ABR7MT77_9FIRM|nr:InlB B-repeat-containing protein [Jutongia hominis]MBC8557013.1 InlB B-repeat-containing protein [Jutongia hominis]